MALGAVLIVLWSYLAAYRVGEPLWITAPVFALLAAACLYTGQAHRQYIGRYPSARILASGFIAWAGLLLLFPFVDRSPVAQALFYLSSAILAAGITLGMLAQVLEWARAENESLKDEFNKGMASRRLLEQEVHDSEQKYRALFEMASDAMFVVDLETLEIQEVNQSAVKLSGRAADKLLRRRITDLCPELIATGASLLGHKRMFDAMLEAGREFTLVRADGARVQCEGSATLVEYHQRPFVQLCVREITERKQIEKQLRQVEKLSALGRLIAGVAHELNNPLAVIMGYAQLLVRQRDSHRPPNGEIEKILHESERAAKIVRSLLTFARSGEPQLQAMDLNSVVATVLDTREEIFRTEQIRVQRLLAPHLPRPMADSAQIEQVLTNLITNAVQAMSQQTSARLLTVATAQAGNVLRCSVADNGSGIPPEILGRIFDPFFTTKAPGQSTGLGLSICHGILEDHNGRIWAESRLGQGTTFFFELPVVEYPVPAPPSTAIPPPAAAAQGHILIVDDEPGIREVFREVLSSLGYQITTASNGREALEQMAHAHYDLIFSDLCMPEMGGETFYTAVQMADANLADRIIFVTGDTVSANSRSFLEATGNRWLSKPFNIAELERLVAETLAGTTAPASSR